MAREIEFPPREDYFPLWNEFSVPGEETEFRPPDPEAEYAAPPGTDHANPDPAQEFTPPGSGRTGSAAPQGRRRMLKRLLFASAALVLLGTVFFCSPSGAPLSPLPAPSAVMPSGSLPPQSTPSVSAAVPSEPTPEAGKSPEATPDVTDAPLSGIPVIRTEFFSFSHEHYGRVYLSNTAALHSVEVSVRDKVLDMPAYSHTLSDEEIARGLLELPTLSTGDLYMENMEAYNAVNGWPSFEMTVNARYENEAGDGEETLSLTVEPEFELGVGVSYMRPDYTWSEVVPPDSFVVTPWAEIEEINYLIADPDAVKDPVSFSVDLSYGGRHAMPEDYETVVEKEEYSRITESGEEIPTVSYTKKLVLRRPDWMPESGTLHVTIVQRLASTGELWVRDYDLDYPAVY